MQEFFGVDCQQKLVFSSVWRWFLWAFWIDLAVRQSVCLSESDFASERSCFGQSLYWWVHSYFVWVTFIDPYLIHNMSWLLLQKKAFLSSSNYSGCLVCLIDTLYVTWLPVKVWALALWEHRQHFYLGHSLTFTWATVSCCVWIFAYYEHQGSNLCLKVTVIGLFWSDLICQEIELSK